MSDAMPIRMRDARPRRYARPFRSVISAIALLAADAGLTGLASAQTITEFPLSAGDTAMPLGIALGPDGNLWFTEAAANKIGRITSAGVLAEFSPPTLASFPCHIAAGPDGNLWFTQLDSASIGRSTPEGVITEFPLPPYASQPFGIAAGPDGNLWFTALGFSSQIGRITPLGVVTMFPIPTVGAGPLGIAAGPDGALWFTEGYADKVGRITTAGVVTEPAILARSSGPHGIAAGPDGNLWFTEQSGNRIGRLTPAGVLTEFATGSSPVAIAAGPDGNLWFNEDASARLAQVTPAGVITHFALPTSSERVPGIVGGSDGNLWFTERHGGKIGRMALTPPATSFFTVPPCRLLDTRDPPGTFGGPALAAGVDRVFPLHGRCGIPSTARAVSVNLTVTESSAVGNLRLYPAGIPLPQVSAINYVTGQTRANNAISQINNLGELAARCTQASGTTHFILDVNGYFAP